MDDKKAIEAARALVDKFCSPITGNIIDEFQALKEALEDKPSREDCMARLECIADAYADCDKPDNINVQALRESIELLKQPTVRWVEWKKGMKVPEFKLVLQKWREADGDIFYQVEDEIADFSWEIEKGKDNIIAYIIIE